MTPGLSKCPVCGGDVHPIAGRCKHCKVDLVEFQDNQKREARRQRAATPVPFSPTAQSQAAPQPAARPPAQADSPHPNTAHPNTAHQDHRGRVAGAAPVQQAPAQPRPSTHRAPPPSFGHHGYQQQPSMWSRRWPLIAGAIALLAIGISAGILIEQARHGSDSTDGERSKRSNSPSLVPDSMPDPGTPGIGGPRPAPNHSGTSGVPSAGDFGPTVVDRVCTKLTDCGLIDSNVRATCQTIADMLRDPYAADKVASGECTYSESSAEACLGEIESISCTNASSDIYDMIDKANRLSECATAMTCN